MYAEVQELLFGLLRQPSKPQSVMIMTEACTALAGWYGGQPPHELTRTGHFYPPGFQSGPQHIPLRKPNDLPIRHQRGDKFPPLDDYEPRSKSNMRGLTTWFIIAHDTL